MSRATGHYISASVCALWLAEFALAFVLVCAMAVSGGAAAVPESWRIPVSLNTANHAALLAVTLGATAGAIGLYRPDVCLAPRRAAQHAAVVALLAFPIALIIGSTLQTGRVGAYAIWLAKVLAVWVVGLLITRWALHVPLTRALTPRRLASVGATGSGRLMMALRSRRGGMFEVAQVIEPGGRTPQPQDLRAARIWAVVAPDATELADPAWLIDLRMRGIRVLHEAGFCEQMLGRVSLDLLGPSWFLEPAGFDSGAASLALKRACDIVVSLVLLVISLPVMGLAALAVRIDSPGPILYRQERVGLGGRVFTLLKFRSMRADAEEGGRPVWAAQADPRVTRVGAFIRSTRIDELPQLFNVLRGDMSLVGPRPERPMFVNELARVIPFYNQRNYLKPGITGWAQVNYPYGASVEDAREKLSYDLYYLRYRSLLFDLFILAATVRVILFREGAR